MLQYYSYLNLAVAVILAHRPPDYQRYRQHGVEDRSHALHDLDLKSVLVKAKKGAVPLFHSLLSHEGIANRSFRLNELLGAIPLVRYELTELFSLPSEAISVNEAVQQTSKGKWKSHVTFECRNSATKPASITRARVERAMPSLASLYTLKSSRLGYLEYTSKTEWDTKDAAILWHKKACVHLTNFGGHIISVHALTNEFTCQYIWHGLARKPLIPTLTASLLLSFGLASVSRYRPVLAARIRESRINLLLDTFINEADSMVIPAMRNLLFREEMVVHALCAI
jgi:hypothetical protein